MAIVKLSGNNTVHATGAASAAILVIPAIARRSVQLIGVVFSYASAPTAGNLIMSAGSTEVFRTLISDAGPGQLSFPHFLPPNGQALTLTLTSGATSGVLNAWWGHAP